MGLDAAEAVIAGDDVRQNLLVRRTEVRPAVDEVNGGGEKEAAHDWVDAGVRCSLYARSAMNCTSFTDRPFTAAMRATSSNSGDALITRPFLHAILKRIGPTSV